MVKRHPWLTALLVVAGALALYYALVPIFHPPYAEVCRKGEYGPPDHCTYLDAVTAFILRKLVWLDEHNGLVAAFAGLAVAGFTGVLWRSTEKLWTQAQATLIEARSGERAWITIDTPKILANIDPEGVLRGIVQLHWKNTGRTPALDWQSLTFVDIAPDEDWVSSNSAVIGPGSNLGVQPFPFELKEAFETRREYISHSTAKYFDIFERTQRVSKVTVKVLYVGHNDPYSLDPKSPQAPQEIVNGIQVQFVSHTAT